MSKTPEGYMADCYPAGDGSGWIASERDNARIATRGETREAALLGLDVAINADIKARAGSIDSDAPEPKGEGGSYPSLRSKQEASK